VRVSQVYVSNSDWLKAADLDGPVNATIVGVEMHSFEDQTTGKRKDQLVLLFDGWDKKLGLNATNASRLAQLLGDETDTWTGHAITLYVDPRVKTPSGFAPAVRIMPVLPGAAQAASPARIRAPYNQPGPGPAPHVATQGLVKRQGKPLPPPVEQYDGPEEEGPPF
jgi:hypothetical protein